MTYSPLTWSATDSMWIGLLFFGTIYLSFGTLNWLLTRKLLPALGIGKPLDPRPLPPGQLRRELVQSAMSVLLFGTGMVFPWGVLKLGWAKLAVNPSWGRVAVEIAVMVVWNDIHFYINHRLLHTKWLRRFHLPHHRSVVTTPFSTYSFHPLEALMLGNVLLVPMMLHDFSFSALLSVPLFSLFFNSVGHANYDFFPGASPTSALSSSRRHHLHHACYQGNFGFLFPFMDQLFGTALPPDAASAQIGQYLARERRGADAA